MSQDTDALQRYASLPRTPSGQVTLDEEGWRDFLTPTEFRILRQGGTERPGSGALTDHDAPGDYHCAGCGTHLYTSEHKFHSGCGWPAFDDEVPHAIRRIEDRSFGMLRTEIRCLTCDGHLGHVFVGEKLTEKNLRHCVNSASIIFVAKS